MRKYLIFFLIISSYNIEAQQYEFINEVVTTYEKDNPIPLDTIFLKSKFIALGEKRMPLEYLNEETIKFWWRNGNIKQHPPIELFLKNFNLSHLKSDINNSQHDSIINFKALNSSFHSSSNEFIKKIRRKNIYPFPNRFLIAKWTGVLL